MEKSRRIHAELVGHYREDGRYPAVMVNVTNRCNLECEHCFIYRPANANESPLASRDEMDDETMLETLAGLRDRHGIVQAVWMGGEPLLKPALLARGIELFESNTITTNGTVPLVDFGPEVFYVASLDGPEEINDAIRGEGVYRRVMRNLEQLPESFSSPVQVQCVVTRRNQDRLDELVEALVKSERVGWMTFSFYVPRREDPSPDAWADNAERAGAVREVMRLKQQYPAFIRNATRSLELMLPPLPEQVTAGCLARDKVLPLYLEGDHFTTPFCCYGNDVDCRRCGAWVVFQLASGMPRYAEASVEAERFAPPAKP
jgi:MoaA/NifB/PqqE/SkfB family radical SAM enzyme